MRSCDNDAAERLTLEMIKRFGAASIHIARELDDIVNALPDISRIAAEMIKRFGADAIHIAREMAAITEGVPEIQYGEVWHDIANAIEDHCNDRCHPFKYRHANDNDQVPSDSRPYRR